MKKGFGVREQGRARKPFLILQRDFSQDKAFSETNLPV